MRDQGSTAMSRLAIATVAAMMLGGRAKASPGGERDRHIAHPEADPRS
jgi:hypothetical protein